MSDIAIAYRNAIVDYLRGAGLPPAVTDIYLDLYNGDPQSGGTSVLLTITGSSTRMSVTALLSAAASGACTNPAAIPIIAESNGNATITHCAFFNAALNGALVTSSPLDAPCTVVVADEVEIPADNLDISLN